MTRDAPTPPTRADVTVDAEAPAPGEAANTSRRLGEMTRNYRPLFPRTPDATSEAGEA